MKLELMWFCCLFVLLSLPATECTKNAPFRGQCEKVGKFINPVKNFALLGHVISTHSVSSALDCSFECMTHPQCASYNCESSDKQQLTCELNDKKANPSSDLTSKPGYNYYDTQENLPDACASSPCLHAECVDSCVEGQGFECLCIEERYGDRCQYWKEDARNYDLVFDSPTDYAEVDFTTQFSAFTICVWFKTQAQGWRTLFSQARDTENTGLYLRCENMMQCEFMFVGEKRLFHLLNPLNDGAWHHICVAHAQYDGLWNVFIDGAWRAGQPKDFAKSQHLKEGKIVIGQKLLVLGGAFDQPEGFVGSLSRFNVWGKLLSYGKIKDLSARECRNDFGDALDWRDFLHGRQVGVEKQKVSLCQSKVPEIDFAFKFPNCDVKDYVTGPSLPALTEVTFCFWLLKRVAMFTVFSYRTEGQPSALGNLIGGLHGLNTYITGTNFNTQFPALVDSTWHHICVSWKNTGVLRYYLDGVRKYHNDNVKAGVTIPSGGKLHLGQWLTTYDGDHQENRCSVGYLSGFNMWSTELSEAFVVALSTRVGTEFGDVVSWKNLAPNIEGGARVIANTGADNTDALETDFELEFVTRTTANLVSWLSMPTLTAFTTCFWVKTSTSSDYLTFLSYAIPGSYNELLFQYKPSTTELMLLIASGYFGTWMRTVNVGTLHNNAWYHLCLAWSSSDGTYTMWHQGEVKKTKTGYRTGHVINGNGTLIIGQDQDSLGGSFELRQSFQGHLTRLNIWDHVLNTGIVYAQSRGCGLWNGNVLPWTRLRYTAHRTGNVKYHPKASCTLAAATVQTKRNQYCQDHFVDSSCTGTCIALFDRKKIMVGKMWRCYKFQALKKSNFGLEYDLSGGLTCISGIAAHNDLITIT